MDCCGCIKLNDPKCVPFYCASWKKEPENCQFKTLGITTTISTAELDELRRKAEAFNWIEKGCVLCQRPGRRTADWKWDYSSHAIDLLTAIEAAKQ